MPRSNASWENNGVGGGRRSSRGKKHAERGVRQAIYVVISLTRSLSPSLSPFLFYCPPVFCPSFPSFLSLSHWLSVLCFHTWLTSGHISLYLNCRQPFYAFKLTLPSLSLFLALVISEFHPKTPAPSLCHITLQGSDCVKIKVDDNTQSLSVG